mgnify:CR=1 FL=1
MYAKRQALLGELRILYTDGTGETIGTNEEWEVTEEGNYKETEFYNGEVYDATVDLEKISWKKASFEQVKIHPRSWHSMSAGTCTRRVSSGTDYKSKERYADL